MGSPCPSDKLNRTSDECSPRRQLPGHGSCGSYVSKRKDILSEEKGVDSSGDTSTRSGQDNVKIGAAFREQTNLDILDLEQKLVLANRNLQESKKRHALEENRTLKAEEELRAMRKNYAGSDVEHILMGNLCRVRDRCKELASASKDADSKYRAIEEQLTRVSDHYADIEKDFEQVKKERQELQAELAQLKQGRAMLEAQDECNKQSIKNQKHNLKMLAAERDETLELLDKAMTQKEQTKQGRQRDVDEKQRQVDALQDKRNGEQRDIRKLITSVDTLVAGLQRGGSYEEPATWQELLRVRDGIHTLIKKETPSDMSVRPEAEGVPTSYKPN